VKLLRSDLRTLIFEVLTESQYSGMSLGDMNSYLDGLGDNTWIILDTETTGFAKTVHYGQLTEIAAIAVRTNNWEGEPEVLGEYHEKIKLHSGSEDRLEREKSLTPEELESSRWGPSRGGEWTLSQTLEFTNYWVWDREYIDEQDAISGLFRFIESYPNPVLVIQNAAFDLKWLSARFQQQMKRYPIVDTLRINQLFLTPVMQTLRHMKDPAAIRFLAASRSGSGLAPIRKGFGLSVEGHHQAINDVKMTLEMVALAIQALRANPDVDKYKESEDQPEEEKPFRTAQGKAMKKIRRMAQRESESSARHAARWRRQQRRWRQRQGAEEAPGEDHT